MSLISIRRLIEHCIIMGMTSGVFVIFGKFVIEYMKGNEFIAVSSLMDSFISTYLGVFVGFFIIRILGHTEENFLTFKRLFKS